MTRSGADLLSKKLQFILISPKPDDCSKLMNPVSLFRSFGFAALIGSVSASCVPEPALAQQPPRGPTGNVVGSYDSREIALLPKFCIFTQRFRDNVPGGNDKAEIDRWYVVMGPTFHAMHHYCYALMYTNRSMLWARDQTTRNFYLRNSILELDYVLQRAPEDFVLLPEILTRKGQSLLRLGQTSQGIEQFERATQIKPDYWAPYAYLSDYFKEAGDPRRAREVLEKGLSFSPDAKGLVRRFAELDSEGSARKDSKGR